MAKVKPVIRIEQSDFDRKFYVYKSVDVTDDPDTTETVRFDEIGSFDTEKAANAAAAKAKG